MTEIRYYPLIDCDSEGTEKVAMIPTPNGNTVKSQSRMWLEEMVPHHFRLYTQPLILYRISATADAGSHRWVKCRSCPVCCFAQTAVRNCTKSEPEGGHMSRSILYAPPTASRKENAPPTRYAMCRWSRFC